MKFADEEFSYYWKVIKVPLLLIIGWSVLALIIAKLSLYWYMSVFNGWAGLILQVAVFCFVGYIIIAENKGQLRNSAWAGALTGILAGIGGAILSIIAINFVPEIIEQSISRAVASGAPEEMVRQMVKIGIYLGFITGPLFGGLIGALVSGMSGIITKKTIRR